MRTRRGLAVQTRGKCRASIGAPIVLATSLLHHLTGGVVAMMNHYSLVETLGVWHNFVNFGDERGVRTRRGLAAQTRGNCWPSIDAPIALERSLLRYFTGGAVAMMKLYRGNSIDKIARNDDQN